MLVLMIRTFACQSSNTIHLEHYRTPDETTAERSLDFPGLPAVNPVVSNKLICRARRGISCVFGRLEKCPDKGELRWNIEDASSRPRPSVTSQSRLLILPKPSFTNNQAPEIAPRPDTFTTPNIDPGRRLCRRISRVPDDRRLRASQEISASRLELRFSGPNTLSEPPKISIVSVTSRASLLCLNRR